jgi:hypothetical protein
MAYPGELPPDYLLDRTLLLHETNLFFCEPLHGFHTTHFLSDPLGHDVRVNFDWISISVAVSIKSLSIVRRTELGFINLGKRSCFTMCCSSCAYVTTQPVGSNARSVPYADQITVVRRAARKVPVPNVGRNLIRCPRGELHTTKVRADLPCQKFIGCDSEVAVILVCRQPEVFVNLFTKWF